MTFDSAAEKWTGSRRQNKKRKTVPLLCAHIGALRKREKRNLALSVLVIVSLVLFFFLRRSPSFLAAFFSLFSLSTFLCTDQCFNVIFVGCIPPPPGVKRIACRKPAGGRGRANLVRRQVVQRLRWTSGNSFLEASRRSHSGRHTISSKKTIVWLRTKLSFP